mmetsp:Transcript_74/g.120  ORF Transcript_74/g.120 Transcript_74/m.120 type:complete len:1044 (-) Transcript_74:171-3302(-)
MKSNFVAVVLILVASLPWLVVLAEKAVPLTLLQKLEKLSIAHEVVRIEDIGESYRFSKYVIADLQIDRKLFHDDFKHYHINEKTGHASYVAENLDCFKIGKIYEFESQQVEMGKVHLNRCNDLFSALLVFGESENQVEYNLEKIQGSDNGRSFSAAFYKVDHLNEDWSCGGHNHDDAHIMNDNDHGKDETKPLDFIYQMKEESPHLRNGRSRSLDGRRGSGTKYVKLLVVNDHGRWLQYGENTHAKTSSVIQRVQRIYEKLNAKYEQLYGNQAYKIAISIAGMITFAHGDPWEGKVAANDEGELDYRDLLLQFNEWRRINSNDERFPPHSVGHLISGYDFQGNTVGLANVYAVCRSQIASAVNQGKGYEDETIATIISHELAHNLGVLHTNSVIENSLVEAPCSGTIMDPNGVRQSSWSSCTVNHLKMFFDGCGSCSVPKRYGVIGSACLEKKPSYTWSLGSQCGNGLKEAGEQCDCGADICEDDPCCDGKTCTFKDDSYECSASDPCCDRATCLITSKEKQRVCREAISECDIPDVCDGQQSRCPYDAVVETGKSCTAKDLSQGACHFGYCNSHSSQCSEYSFMDGPCTWANENDGDAGCGDLRCHYFGDESGTCRNIQESEAFVQVNDGTPCGNGKVCDSAKRACVDPSELEVPEDLKCSNGLLDDGETDIDCGGPNCESCLPGESCINDDDCFTHCVGSSVTEAEKEESELEFINPPEGTACNSFKTVSKCGQWTGCIWLEEFTRCKPTGLLPPSGTCSSQVKKQTCINFQKCQWSDKGGRCVETKIPLKMGKCFGSIFTGYENEEEGDEWWRDMYNKILEFWNTYPEYSYAIIAVVGLALLCCLYSCCGGLCRRRRYRSQQQNNNRRQKRRSTRRRVTGQDNINYQPSNMSGISITGLRKENLQQDGANAAAGPVVSQDDTPVIVLSDEYLSYQSSSPTSLQAAPTVTASAQQVGESTAVAPLNTGNTTGIVSQTPPVPVTDSGNVLESTANSNCTTTTTTQLVTNSATASSANSTSIQEGTGTSEPNLFGGHRRLTHL